LLSLPQPLPLLQKRRVRGVFRDAHKLVSLLANCIRASLKTLAFITSTPAPSPEEKGTRSF